MCRNSRCSIILFETFRENCSTCFLIYRRKASLDQRPIIMIVQTGTSPKYIAIAAPDLMECVPISPRFKFKRSQPIDSIAASSAATISSEDTCSIPPPRQTADTGVSSSAPSYRRILRINAAQIFTGHNKSSSERFCVTVSSFSSFF